MVDTPASTHGHAGSVLRSHRTRTAENSAAHLLPQLRAGMSLLDVVHAHQVLRHVADPVAALREMIRACRPGGVVAARDADPVAGQEWGATWAERITGSAVARQLLASRLATEEDLRTVAAAWRDWAAQPAGWLSILHGEVLVRV